MIHAYDQSYLEDVLNNVGYMFDVAVNLYFYNIDLFADEFKQSDIAIGIENKDPEYLSGHSSLELLSMIIKEDVPTMFFSPDKSPEFWVGYIYAYANWYLCKPFSELFEIVKPSRLLELYHPYHEASDIKVMELFTTESVSIIEKLRKDLKINQTELSLLTQIPVRTIRMYEKNPSSLLKASGETIYRLSEALGVSMEYLLINAR